MPQRNLYRLALTLLISTQVACSGGLIKLGQPELTPEVQQRFAEVTVEQALHDVEKKVKNAYQEELNYYSPQNLGNAEDTLNALRTLVKQEKVEKQEVIIKVLTIEASLDKGMVTKATVQSQLADSFAMKSALDDVSAIQYEKRTYEKLMGRIKDLIEYIEEGNAEKARSKQPELIADMKAFETEAIKFNTLNPAELVLNEARDKDADDFAPKTYQQAVMTYDRVANYVMANPHDKENVTKMGQEALFDARHALHVGEAAKALMGIKEDAKEDIVLDEERRLQRIAEGLEHKDVRDRSLHDQAVSLSMAGGRLIQDKQELSKKVEELVAQLKQLGEESAQQQTDLQKKLKQSEQQVTELKQQHEQQLEQSQQQMADLNGQIEQLTQELDRLKMAQLEVERQPETEQSPQVVEEQPQVQEVEPPQTEEVMPVAEIEAGEAVNVVDGEAIEEVQASE